MHNLAYNLSSRQLGKCVVELEIFEWIENLLAVRTHRHTQESIILFQLPSTCFVQKPVEKNNTVVNKYSHT